MSTCLQNSCNRTPLAAGLVVLAALAADRQAIAADQTPTLPLKARAVAPSYDWNGFYFGGHVGYGSGHTDARRPMPTSPTRCTTGSVPPFPLLTRGIGWGSPRGTCSCFSATSGNTRGLASFSMPWLS